MTINCATAYSDIIIILARVFEGLLSLIDR